MPKNVHVAEASQAEENVSIWIIEKFSSLCLDELLPSPIRKQIVSRLQEIWKRLSIQIVKNLFTGNEYFFDDEVDYSGDTKSKSILEF